MTPELLQGHQRGRPALRALQSYALALEEEPEVGEEAEAEAEAEAGEVPETGPP